MNEVAGGTIGRPTEIEIEIPIGFSRRGLQIGSFFLRHLFDFLQSRPGLTMDSYC